MAERIQFYTPPIDKPNTPPVIFRLLLESDLPALEWGGEFAHFRRLYRSTYQRTKNGSVSMFVAEIPGVEVIGQLFLQYVCDRPELADGKFRAYVYSFRIKPEYRSLGIGAAFMRYIEKHLRQRGNAYITLNVAKENTRGIDFYKRLGFEIVAHEPGEWSYPDQNGVWKRVVEPAWRMEKKIE